MKNCRTYKIVVCGVNEYPYTVTEDNREINAFATEAEAKEFIEKMKNENC